MADEQSILAGSPHYRLTLQILSIFDTVTREKKDKHFIKKPIYPGGKDALRKFISQNLKYPQEAIDSKVSGTVLLKYTIDYKGVVTEAHVVSGIGSGCDEEAIRLTKLLKFDVPSQGRKVRVHFHKDIRIHFRLPKENKPKASGKMALNYQITTSPNTDSEANVKPRQSYSYTVTIKK